VRPGTARAVGARAAHGGDGALDDRKQRVLQAIVDDYVRTAEPVGSRTVARRYNLGVSPATIRNEMADLEDMGYLEQPHTSAGRVPSDKGYRHYVNTLVAGPEAAAVREAAMRQVLAAKARRIEDVVRQAAHVLAEMTDCLALAQQPAEGEERLAALQIVPLGGEGAVLVLVADDGRARTKLLRFPHAPAPEELERIGRALSERLRGLRLCDLGTGMDGALAAALGQYRHLVQEVRGLLGERAGESDRLLVEGATNLLKQPEFHDVASAQRVLQSLEREELLEDLLGVPAPRLPGLEVAIGRELPVPDMAGCSLVTAVYAGPGGVCGRIGVLGPRRMDYGRVMRVVESVAAAVTASLAPEPLPPVEPPRSPAGGAARARRGRRGGD
jgi:heat-inducible transcriptional repressor